MVALASMAETLVERKPLSMASSLWIPAKQEGHTVGAIELDIAEESVEVAVVALTLERAACLHSKTLEAAEAALETADDAEAIRELIDVGLIVTLPFETKLAMALEIGVTGMALGIKAAGSVTREVPLNTANGVGIAVIPADDNALCRAAVGVIPADDNALWRAAAEGCIEVKLADALGKTDWRAMAIALGRFMNISANEVWFKDEVGTIEDEIKLANDSGIVVAAIKDVKFPEAEAMIAEAIEPVGDIVTLPATIAELKEFKALEMALVGIIVLLAKAAVIEAIWADMEAILADIEIISGGIEVADIIDDLEPEETVIAELELEAEVIPELDSVAEVMPELDSVAEVIEDEELEAEVNDDTELVEDMVESELVEVIEEAELVADDVNSAEADWTALEILATIDEGEIELALKLELMLALALEKLDETLASAEESEAGLIGVVAVAIMEEILASWEAIAELVPTAVIIELMAWIWEAKAGLVAVAM